MSDAPRPLPPKKEVALALLEGPSLFVHLDPRKSGVMVPKWFTGQPQLVLQVGLNMAIPIPDLKVDEEGVSCTLSFNRTPFFCRLPWSAVYALVGDDGRGAIWQEDVPPEVAVQMQKQQAQKAPAAKKPRAKLAAVEDEKTKKKLEEPTRLQPAKRSAARDEEKRKPAEMTEAPAPRALRVEVSRPELASEAKEPAAEERRESPREDKPGKKRRELPPYLRVIK